MTVTYTSKVTTSTGFGCFLKLLARWRGSIYKLIWADLCLYMILYYSINFTYRFALDGEQKLTFEKIVRYCEKYGNLIPLSFVLGFYVNIVVTRWWNQYSAIPFPDDLALLVSANVKGENDRGRVIRRTIMRYVCLSFAMTLRLISPKVKKRFPTLDHFIEAGLLQRDEKKIIEAIENEFPSYSKNWLPLAWASNIITRARHEGMIRDDPAVDHILGEINKFRSKCGSLLDYDWISIPLVYTQVVTLAVYTYFITTLFSRQWIEPHKEDDMDLYFPFLTVLEFFFYMGWLRVAETLINPFGDDDDDFEVVWMIDRHVQVTYLIVDKIHHEHPKLMRDQHWATMAPTQLPHTLASEQFKYEHPIYSTNGLSVGGMDAEILLPDAPRKSGTRVDGQGVNRSGSLLRRLFQRRIARTTELHHINTDDTSEEASENLNLIESTSEVNNDFSEFDNLKKIRMALMKQRILTYLKVLKEKTNDEKTNTLVEEMMKNVDDNTNNL